MKINLNKKPNIKEVLYNGLDIQQKIIDLHEQGEAEQEWGIPVCFLQWRQEGKDLKKKIFHSLSYSGKELARTIDERNILLDAIKQASELDNIDDIKSLLKNAEEKMIWSFIERGYYPDVKRNPTARKILDKYIYQESEEE